MAELSKEQIRRRILNIPEDLPKQVEVEVVSHAESLRQDVLNCTDCALREGCTQTVPGAGPVPADIMFVGEGPGANEDEQGQPFVGKGGQLLNKAIEAIGWNRHDIYITNIVKCRPPGNRQPTVKEISACYKHLQKEIEAVQPKVIVCWGATAANTLIHPDFRITQEHSHWFEQDNRRLIALYHPSYLLRLGEGSEKQTKAKWQVFQGLEKVKQYQDSGFSVDVL